MGLTMRNPRAFLDLRRRLRDAPKLVPLLAQRVVATLMKEVADEFRESRDPYGNPWAPVVRNRGRDRRARAGRQRRGLGARSDKPLIDTGRMRASVSARAEGSHVRISIPVSYASYHQYGTRTIQRRQILPEDRTGGLGPRWSRAVDREAVKLLKEHFPGGG